MNRKLAAHILQKGGHHVSHAGSGAEALAEIERERFDVVLMDVEMPGMSGLEAARRIRARECARGAAARRLPIVAVTARAMAGDREVCLAAGMDDYVTKPIAGEQVLAAIARAVAGGERSRVQPPQPVAAVDAEAAVAALGGDRLLFGELVRVFLETSAAAGHELAAARAAADLRRVGLAGHSLKSSLATVGAFVGRSIAADLETAARCADGARAWDLCTLLVAELERVERALRAASAASPTGAGTALA
ncbi:MAG: response regulator [Burkholderiales bacterium]|nr:response regulator [Burkholderiales bacterium]